MDVFDSEAVGPGHSIELGWSSWDPNERAVRNRFANARGGFNRAGSSEVPEHDLLRMVAINADRGGFSDAQLLADAVRALAARLAAIV